MSSATNQDADQLRLLSIFHFVVAGLTGLMSCFPIFHLAIGLVMLTGGIGPGPHANGEGLPAGRGDAIAGVMIGGVFVALASLIIACGWLLAIAIFFVGRNLARHRRYMYCLTVAAIECLMMPFGTILGVFTIIVLMRPAVKEMFQQ